MSQEGESEGGVRGERRLIVPSNLVKVGSALEGEAVVIFGNIARVR